MAARSEFGKRAETEGPWARRGLQADAPRETRSAAPSRGGPPPDPDSEEFQEYWEKRDGGRPSPTLFLILGLLMGAALLGGYLWMMGPPEFASWRGERHPGAADPAATALAEAELAEAELAEAELAEAEARIADLERQIADAQAGGPGGAVIDPAAEDLRTEELEDLLESLGAEKTALEAKVAAVEDEKAALADQLADARARGQELEARVEEQQGMILIARGLDHPPCWPSPDSATVPDYIFNVDISDDGLLVSKAFPPRRSGEFAALPTGEIALGQRVTVDRFRAMAAPLYKAAQSEGCRHFVRVYEGQHTEVDRYKSQRDAIESYFYIYRVRR